MTLFLPITSVVPLLAGFATKRMNKEASTSTSGRQ